MVNCCTIYYQSFRTELMPEQHEKKWVRCGHVLNCQKRRSPKAEFESVSVSVSDTSISIPPSLIRGVAGSHGQIVGVLWEFYFVLACLPWNRGCVQNSFCSLDFRTLRDHCCAGRATRRIMSDILNLAASCLCYESTIKESSLKILLHERFLRKLSVSPPQRLSKIMGHLLCWSAYFRVLVSFGSEHNCRKNALEHWGRVGFYFIITSIYTNIEAFTLWVPSLYQLDLEILREVGTRTYFVIFSAKHLFANYLFSGFHLHLLKICYSIIASSIVWSFFVVFYFLLNYR